MKREKVDLTVHTGGCMKLDGRWDGSYEYGVGVGAGEMSGTWLMPFLLLSVREEISCGRDLQEHMKHLGFHWLGREEMCRTLQKMEREELVSTVGEEVELLDQRYRITNLGNAYLEFWANSLEDYEKEMSAFFEVYAGDTAAEVSNGTDGISPDGGPPNGGLPDGSQATLSSIFGLPGSEAEDEDERFSKEIGSPGVVFIMAGGGLRHMGGAPDGFLGYPPERLLWQDILEFVHPDEVNGFRALIDEVMKRPGTSRCVEIQVRDAHGRWCPAEATVLNVLEAPIKTDGGLLVVNLRGSR